eukprot:m.209172 g.209172  ORF g.209172 m.209172 type:complete len:98 (+) comp15043_c7_seq1:175-468(+)
MIPLQQLASVPQDLPITPKAYDNLDPPFQTSHWCESPPTPVLIRNSTVSKPSHVRSPNVSAPQYQNEKRQHHGTQVFVVTSTIVHTATVHPSYKGVV